MIDSMAFAAEPDNWALTALPQLVQVPVHHCTSDLAVPFTEIDLTVEQIRSTRSPRNEDCVQCLLVG